MRDLEIRERSSASTGLSNAGSGIGAVGAERGISGPGQMSLQQQQQGQGGAVNVQQKQPYAQSMQQHLRV